MTTSEPASSQAPMIDVSEAEPQGRSNELDDDRAHSIPLFERIWETSHIGQSIELVTSPEAALSTGLDLVTIPSEYPFQSVAVVDIAESRTVCRVDSMPVKAKLLATAPDSATSLFVADENRIRQFSVPDCTLLEFFEFTSPADHVALGRATDGGVLFAFSRADVLTISHWETPEIAENRNGVVLQDIRFLPIDTTGTNHLLGYDGVFVRVFDPQNLEESAAIFAGPGLRSFSTARLESGIELALILAYEWNNGVVAKQISSGAQLFDFPANNLARMAVADHDADSFDEIAFADAQHGGIHVLDRSGAEIFFAQNPGQGVAALHFADFQRDGTVEIAWVSLGDDGLHWTSINTPANSGVERARLHGYFDGNFHSQDAHAPD